MKKVSPKLKLIIIILIIILAVIVSVILYLLIFKQGVSYFGFTIPDFSGGAKLGDAIGDAVNSNPWQDAKLNPFENSS